jgi:glycosyltransferase involved in cell wall biosynthesis
MTNEDSRFGGMQSVSDQAGTTAVMCFSGGSGGMELDTVKLADLLATDCRVVLFCKQGSMIHGLYEKGAKKYACEPVKFRSRTLSPAMLARVRSAIKKRKIRNVIFFGASELKTLYFAFLGLGLNVIVRHGTTKSTPKRGLIHRLVYSCVDYHVALSRHLLKNVKTIVPLGGKADFRIITSSFNAKNLRKGSSAEQRGSGLRIAHVGRVAQGKGQTDAVQACKELKDNGVDFHLDLLGDYQDKKYLRQLDAMITQLGLDDSVELHGHVDNVGDYMITADVFLFPSYGEGMSNAMIEALHYGPVCLSYSNTVFPEFRDMGFYLVLANDQDQSDLAEKLLDIVRNLDEEKTKSERNVELALKYFNRDRERDDWLEILD